MPAAFPATRLRRLRRTGALRDLVRETTLAAADLVLPLFVEEGLKGRTPIASMPGVDRHGIASVVQEGRGGACARRPRGPALRHPRREGRRRLRRLGRRWCGPARHAGDQGRAPPSCSSSPTSASASTPTTAIAGRLTAEGSVDNDASLELLARTAVSHARAGADAVAPSDMMDGRVGALRAALDAEGFTETPIIAYSAKYASAFYGPFREAAGSAPSSGDRKSYQMDPGNAEEALREVALDVQEGADMVMVKPAVPYLDVLWRVKEATRMPVAAYHVGGEYVMIKAAAAAGHLDERTAVLETLTSIRRAGADIVITYYAKDAAQWLQ